MNAASDSRYSPVTHYENFPVASWLCPRPLRAPVAAIYWFARTADDIADEGDAPAMDRLADLARYGAALEACLQGREPAHWPHVFGPLRNAIERFDLPGQPMRDLLSAFEQDVGKSRDGAGYATRVELLDYCRRSADPVGRLLLHLYRVDGALALAQGDKVCTALQLINFWQDAGVDLARGRYYVPAEDCRRHGMDPLAPETWATHPARRALVADLVHWARNMMLAGSPIVHQVPGRAGWELRLVVQGGLRILHKIEAMGYDTFAARPRLRRLDAAPMLWRALGM